MPWFRIDDTFAFHPKVLAAGNAAVGAWVRLGSYCAAHLTDGFVPELMARMIAADCITALINARLLVQEPDGYRIHDYLSYQPSKRDVQLDREEARDRRKSKAKNNPRRRSGERPDGRGGEGSGIGSGSDGESEERGPLPGNPSEDTRRVVDRWRSVAENVLDALNVARKRVRSVSRGISPTYDSLRHIADRLEAGKSATDCLHVIEVCEAECSADAGAFKWFDSVTPFRPDNFERKSAADPGLIFAKGVVAERRYKNFQGPRAAVAESKDVKL
jgi:hypothetical protein